MTCNNKKYSLVLFLENSEFKEIDIVPSSWLAFENKFDGIGCKYMASSSLKNVKNCRLLQKMVERCEDPDPTWAKFHVEIRGVAGNLIFFRGPFFHSNYKFLTKFSLNKCFSCLKTMEEAKKKLSKLETQPYVFTTDNEQSAKTKAANEEKIYKLKAVSKNTSKVDNIFSQTAVNLTDDISEVKNKTNESKNSNSSLTSSAGCTSSSSPSSPQLSAVKIKRKLKNIHHPKVKRKRIASTPPKSPLSSTKLSSLLDQHRLAIETNTTVTNDILYDYMKQTYNSMTKQMSNLKGQILGISSDIAQILAEVKKNHSTVLESSHTEPEENAKAKKIVFPLHTIEDFDGFDVKLQDIDYRNKIIKRLFFSLNARISITRNMGNIIRSYISRDLAMKFVAKKSTSTKRAFKDTTFFKCIKTAIKRKFDKNEQPIADNVYHQSLASILNNAKDWDGFRLSRIKKQPNENNETNENLVEHSSFHSKSPVLQTDSLKC